VGVKEDAQLGSLKVIYTVDGDPGENIMLIQMSDNTSLFNQMKGDNGVFEVGNLEEGAYVIFGETNHMDFPGLEVPVYIESDQHVEKKISIQTGMLKLKVTDMASNAIAQPSVGFVAHETPLLRNFILALGPMIFSKSMQMDDEGSLVFKGLPVGKYDITVAADGYETKMITRCELSPGGQFVRTVSLKKIISPGSLKLKVTKADGSKVDGIVVPVLCDAHGDPLYSPVKNMESVFSFMNSSDFLLDNIAPGDYMLRLINVGLGPHFTTSVTIRHNELLEKEIIVPEGGVLSVHIVDEAGGPVPNVPITLLDPNQNDISFQVRFMPMQVMGNYTGKSGIVTRAHLEPGEYTVSAKASGGSLKSKKIVVVSGEKTEVILVVK